MTEPPKLKMGWSWRFTPWDWFLGVRFEQGMRGEPPTEAPFIPRFFVVHQWEFGLLLFGVLTYRSEEEASIPPTEPSEVTL
jgi:hypothetical protein